MKDQKQQELLDAERLMRPVEVAEILRCSVDYVWQLCREFDKDQSKGLRNIRKGRHRLIRRQDVIDYIASRARRES